MAGDYQTEYQEIQMNTLSIYHLVRPAFRKNPSFHEL